MPKLGETVLYVTSKGQEVPAIVLTTPETFKEGSHLEPLQEGELNLMALRIKGPQTLLNIPNAESAAAKSAEAGDEDGDEFGEVAPVVRFWKPLE